MITIKINNKDFQVKENISILDACKENNIDIPTLCYLKEINEIGACRMCLVEVKGNKNLVASCVTPVKDGMEIWTDNDRINKARKTNLELILSEHDKDCPNCPRNLSCELQKLTLKYLADIDHFGKCQKEKEVDTSTSYLVRDNNKCILCNKCVAVCEEVQNIGVIGKNQRGINTHIGCAFEKDLADSPCIACGQCVLACPTGALSEKSEINNVIEALANKNLHVIVATAPAVRVALGEEFDNPIGTNVKGKMVAALKHLGFEKVFDLNFGADLTIMEEAHELIERIQNKGVLPMFTSCSPGWIKYVEQYHPDLISNLSTCKSPQQMFGAIIKTYYARKFNINSADIFVVTVMPCIAKKMEKDRDYQSASGYKDVDAVLTTRELAKMIKDKEIDFNELKDESFDQPLGPGASVIFGSTGGVMEAALRTAVETLTGKPLEKIDFTEVRGMKGIKEAQYQVNDINIRVAIVSGISNAKELLAKIKNKEVNYDFIEFMTCPGGCINGGGQPIVPTSIKSAIDVKALRAKAIYEDDKNLPIRKAHENPAIKELYANYLITPGSEKAEHILHTKYHKQDKYK